MSGKVFLIGAGPGDPELLTVKAVRILREADLILHDDLVSQAVLTLASNRARIVNVGRRCGAHGMPQEAINALMVASARAGLAVVRLKGGDPLIFGRAAEQIVALETAAIDFIIVPGVTAASAAAAAAHVALTDRRLGSTLVVLPGHRAAQTPPPDWRAVRSLRATIAVYMPGPRYGSVVSQLGAAGFAAGTPCLAVSRATTPEEQVRRARLDELLRAELPAPSLLIVAPPTLEVRS
jgi:uroporphyrin-III C-methyltransferase